MSMDEDLRDRLLEEGHRSARVNLDVDTVVKLGRRGRRRRHAALVVGAALGAGLLGITAWQVHLVSAPALPAGTVTATPSRAGDAVNQRPTMEPSPGDPAYAWPVEGPHNTQMDWWNSPGLDPYEEVAAAHPRVLVVDTAAMAVVEDNQLAPTFEAMTPTDPVPIDPEWPANSIVVLDAVTFEVLGTADLTVVPDPEVYWPLPPGSEPVPDSVATQWADAVPGYQLAATSDAPYGDTGTQLLLYQDDSSLAIVVAVTTGEHLQLQQLDLRLDGDELTPIDVPHLADAGWGQDEYGFAFAGVDATGTCSVRIWHQQTEEPIIQPDASEIEALVSDVVPRAAALACG